MWLNFFILMKNERVFELDYMLCLTFDIINLIHDLNHLNKSYRSTMLPYKRDGTS